MYGRNAGGQGISLISNDGHPPAKMVPIEPIKTQPQVFPFLELPAEIRNMIYSYLMIPKYPVYVYVRRFQSAVSTGLLFANRQIYQEASTAFYSNARGIVINECHFLTRASCRRVFFKDPPPMHAYSEHPFLPLPHSSHHNSREERHHSNLQAYRHPSLRYTQPCVLAVMAEIEISLAWLPRSDNTEMAIESIMYEVAAMLHCTLKLLRQTGDQKGKRIILIFGDLFFKDSERRFFGIMKDSGVLMHLSQLSRIRPIQVYGNITPVFLSRLEEAFTEEHGVLLRQPDSFATPVQQTSHW